MPARVVLVLEDFRFAEEIVERLLWEGAEAIALPSSVVALDALEASVKIELLVTCSEFAAGPPNGIALARMTRMKRPEVKVLFIGSTEFAAFAEGLGTYVVTPTTVEHVTTAVIRMLETQD